MNPKLRSVLAIALGIVLGYALHQHVHAGYFYGEVDNDGYVSGHVIDEEDPLPIRERTSVYGSPYGYSQQYRYDRYYEDGTHDVQRIYCTRGPNYEDCRYK